MGSSDWVWKWIGVFRHAESSKSRVLELTDSLQALYRCFWKQLGHVLCVNSNDNRTTRRPVWDGVLVRGRWWLQLTCQSERGDRWVGCLPGLLVGLSDRSVACSNVGRSSVKVCPLCQQSANLLYVCMCSWPIYLLLGLLHSFIYPCTLVLFHSRWNSVRSRWACLHTCFTVSNQTVSFVENCVDSFITPCQRWACIFRSEAGVVFFCFRHVQEERQRIAQDLSELTLKVVLRDGDKVTILSSACLYVCLSSSFTPPPPSRFSRPCVMVCCKNTLNLIPHPREISPFSQSVTCAIADGESHPWPSWNKSIQSVSHLCYSWWWIPSLTLVK